MAKTSPPVKIWYRQRNAGMRPKGSPLGRPNRPFRAKYKGTCRRCDKPIHPGDPVVRADTGYRHRMCVREIEFTTEPGASPGDLAEYVELRTTARERDRKLVKTLTAEDRPGEPGPTSLKGSRRS